VPSNGGVRSKTTSLAQAYEMFVDGRHGARSACRLAVRRDDAPGLRDRIDAA
jgi:hypothetical protein